MTSEVKVASNGSGKAITHSNGTGAIELQLHISDPDLLAELSKRDEPERSEFAMSAMKIGVIAFRQAQGQVDAHQIQDAGESVIRDMSNALEKHQFTVMENIGGCIKEYFDPSNGLFTQRVRGLVGQNEETGELERIIRRQVEGDGSFLAKTLMAYVGNESPLMRVLDPESTSGLITTLRHSTESTLSVQQERILGEFSLDNSESALTRLVAELQKNHGDVGKALEERIAAVVGEFSLDKDDSALSRLMSRVEGAQRQISKQFSLDEEGSALARMQKELLEVLEKEHKTNTEFRIDVMKTLTEMTSRRQEAERGTRHGLEFEEAVFDFINERQTEGDIATKTGNTTGRIRNNRKGDVVVKLGPERAAPGAQIVVEAKQDASYTVERALTEIGEARRNRDASIGVFVFSRRVAPKEILDPVARYGDDVVVVWDAEDPATDVFLEAALSIAKALCVRSKSANDQVGADIDTLDTAIREIERQANGLEEITKSATAIESHTGKILDRARIMRNGLDRQISVLDETVGALRDLISTPE